MADQQDQKKKGKPKKVARGSQKDHKAYAKWDQPPEKIRAVLRRIAQSSGFPAAERWAKEHGVDARLLPNQEKY